MRLRYRCPQCKRRLKHHWTDREDASGLALASIEPIGYVLAMVIIGLGVVLNWWQIVVALAVLGGVVALIIYRLYLRNARRYYCPVCDRVFRADFLREHAHAPQITEIAS